MSWRDSFEKWLRSGIMAMAFVVSRFVAPRNCFHNLVGDILEDKILGHGNVLEGLPQTSDAALAFSSEPPKGNSCPQLRRSRFVCR